MAIFSRLLNASLTLEERGERAVFSSEGAVPKLRLLKERAAGKKPLKEVMFFAIKKRGG